MKNKGFQVDLTGKTAVVTGAGGVLCSGFSKALAESGASVAMLDLNKDAAQKFADEINAAGGCARAYACNVLDKAGMFAVADEVMKDFGHIDILLNGAGGSSPKGNTDKEYFEPGDIEDEKVKSFFDIEDSGFGFVNNLNLLGTVITTQAFARHMVKAGGCIVNMSSMSAFTALTKSPAYSSAKAGVSNFTQWCAVHFAKAGIRVNALAPGFFSTIQNKFLLWNEDGTPTARTGKIIAHTPMGRFGVPEDLVGGLLYLVSEEAAGFVTGVILPIDGGFSAYTI